LLSDPEKIAGWQGLAAFSARQSMASKSTKQLINQEF
jgi:hypothetical protein